MLAITTNNDQCSFENTIDTFIQSNELTEAVKFINSHYDKNPERLDGFARIGGIYREQKDWQTAASWMRRDFEQGRMSPEWQLRYAEVLLEIGKDLQALDLVKKVYANNPELTDGYARLGWSMARSIRWNDCNALMETDYKYKRLSFKWYLHYAYALMQLGTYDLSAVLINKAYSENNTNTETNLSAETASEWRKFCEKTRKSLYFSSK